MKYAVFLALNILLVLFSVSRADAKLSCALTNEKHALDTRAMQSHFMVAALACGEQKKYNNFVKKFKTELVENGRYIKDYFRRNYSNDSEYKMNQFITALANESSRRSLEKTSAQYCAEAEDLFGKAESAKSKKASDVAEKLGFAKIHKITSCN